MAAHCGLCVVVCTLCVEQCMGHCSTHLACAKILWHENLVLYGYCTNSKCAILCQELIDNLLTVLDGH